MESYIMFAYLMKKLAAALLLIAAYAWADNPSTVAIRNAKIVTVSGAVIAKGTVVVRKGLIEAVGENVTVPADAWVVEGEGMTVYPGLIDRSAPWAFRARRRRGSGRNRPRRAQEAAAGNSANPAAAAPHSALQADRRIGRRPPVG